MSDFTRRLLLLAVVIVVLAFLTLMGEKALAARDFDMIYLPFILLLAGIVLGSLAVVFKQEDHR